jgi:hypothetical protein
MKKLIVLMMIALNCQADTVATAKNNDGGLFVLTDIPCEKKNTRLAYTTSDSKTTKMGCWFVDDNFVHIIWDQVGLRSYDFSIWKMAKTTKETM